MTITRIYSRGCDLAFSDAFITEYERRSGSLWQQAFPSIYTWPYANATSVDTDSLAIAIVEEFGGEWAAGDKGTLATITYPTLLAPYITFHPYAEKPIHIHMSDLIKSVTDDTSHNIVWFYEQLRAIDDARERVCSHEDVLIL